MDTVKIKKNKAKMVAHQGLSGLECGNTCAAFIAAGNRSYWGIECDIHRTADGQFVVFHDDSTFRLTKKDHVVEQTRYEVLKDLILPDIDGSFSRTDLRIPTLREYVSICKKYGKHCVIELKNLFSAPDIEKIIGIVESLGYLQSATFISFGLQNLLCLRDFLPEQSAQYLVSKREDGLIEILTKNRLDIDIYLPVLDQALLSELKARGIAVNCWTCDDPKRAEELADMGVDYITSNILE